MRSWYKGTLVIVAVALAGCGGRSGGGAGGGVYEDPALYGEMGRAFLEQNAQRSEITVTASGLQYEVVRQGTGPRPGPRDRVTVHYRGALTDGRVFDATTPERGPITFPLDRVIDGWTEGIQLMPVGSMYRFFIPSELAYGREGRPPVIPGNAVLIFEVELIEIQ